MSEQTGQTHPLYATDRDQVDALLGHQGDPGPEQLTVAARLVMRYGDFPGADDIKQDIQKVVTGWGLDSHSLNARCREIWASVGSLVSNSIAILVPVLMLPTRRDKCRGMGDPQ